MINVVWLLTLNDYPCLELFCTRQIVNQKYCVVKIGDINWFFQYINVFLLYINVYSHSEWFMFVLLCYLHRSDNQCCLVTNPERLSLELFCTRQIVNQKYCEVKKGDINWFFQYIDVFLLYVNVYSHSEWFMFVFANSYHVLIKIMITCIVLWPKWPSLWKFNLRAHTQFAVLLIGLPQWAVLLIGLPQWHCLLIGLPQFLG